MSGFTQVCRYISVRLRMNCAHLSESHRHGFLLLHHIPLCVRYWATVAIHTHRPSKSATHTATTATCASVQVIATSSRVNRCTPSFLRRFLLGLLGVESLP